MSRQAAYNLFTSFLRRRQFKGLYLDRDLQGSMQLLFHILSKRTEKVKEADLEQLVLWARNKGKLQMPSLIFSKVEPQELGQLLWDAVKEGKKDKKIVLELRNKIQRQEKVTESPSSSVEERVGRTKATDCGRQQQGAAVSTGQPPGQTAEAAARSGSAERQARSQAERGRPAPSLRRPRGRADFGRETEGSLLLSNSATREMGIPGGSAALESEQAGRGRIRGVSSPVLTVTQQGRSETAPPPHLPAAPRNGGGDAAQPGCHGNNNAESSSVTDGEMATPQQKFQHFSNSLQKSEDGMKKYSSTECFPRYQEG